HVVVEFEHHVFVGDLVTQGFHSWLELGMLDEWLKRLEEIKGLEPEVVHTGRGGSGDGDLVERQEQYLKTVIEIVRKQHPKPGSPLSEKISKRMMDEIVRRYPSYDYPRFVENGLSEVWKRMARRPADF
ncbi:MAG: MBL fold metallo-hydrolase, partial [Bdellovibrionota bacterium]